ncbi:MAG: phosphomethylpyrimidine synthase ThiC [Deltaproteobacteria bacterium]|nr:MAG: phosphomethylpyrimidine synthase ThiC [Deltaproteobacteria bacterium]
MTQLEIARVGKVSSEMEQAAAAENVSSEKVRELIASGRAVLPKNKRHQFAHILAIGEGLRTKVNANIGTSGPCSGIEREIAKLDAAVAAGTDSVMDLSTGPDFQEVRQMVLERSPVMVGAVPIYMVAIRLRLEGQSLSKMSADGLLRSIETQCAEGIDYITVHCGVTREVVRRLDHCERLMPSVSRGGSILMQWMEKNNKENPLYEDFNSLLDIAHTYDVTLSLGDGFRPGTVVDATDGPQVEELIVLGELARRARARGVQVIIEGPGHVPLNQVVANVIMEKQLCDGAPFYLLGPLTTDLAPGYDHITGAIGGAIAAAAGADFLCYVTPAEHLCHPNADDVRAGVIAARIAGHSADIAKSLPGAIERDRQMSIYRRDLNWDGMLSEAIDPDWARERVSLSSDGETCTMCGELCAVKLSRRSAKHPTSGYSGSRDQQEGKT